MASVADRIEKRRTFAGTGMGTNPDSLEELEKRRDLHQRLIQGKPEKSFGQHLSEKMRKLRGEQDAQDEQPEEQEPEAQEQGAIEPHMGLQPSQDSKLVGSGKGRRSGRVIVKG